MIPNTLWDVVQIIIVTIFFAIVSSGLLHVWSQIVIKAYFNAKLAYLMSVHFIKNSDMFVKSSSKLDALVEAARKAEKHK